MSFIESKPVGLSREEQLLQAGFFDLPEMDHFPQGSAWYEDHWLAQDFPELVGGLATQREFLLALPLMLRHDGIISLKQWQQFADGELVELTEALEQPGSVGERAVMEEIADVLVVVMSAALVQDEADVGEWARAMIGQVECMGQERFPGRGLPWLSDLVVDVARGKNWGNYRPNDYLDWSGDKDEVSERYKQAGSEARAARSLLLDLAGENNLPREAYVPASAEWNPFNQNTLYVVSPDSRKRQAAQEAGVRVAQGLPTGTYERMSQAETDVTTRYLQGRDSPLVFDKDYPIHVALAKLQALYPLIWTDISGLSYAVSDTVWQMALPDGEWVSVLKPQTQAHIDEYLSCMQMAASKGALLQTTTVVARSQPLTPFKPELFVMETSFGQLTPTIDLDQLERLFRVNGHVAGGMTAHSVFDVMHPDQVSTLVRRYQVEPGGLLVKLGGRTITTDSNIGNREAHDIYQCLGFLEEPLPQPIFATDLLAAARLAMVS